MKNNTAIYYGNYCFVCTQQEKLATQLFGLMTSIVICDILFFENRYTVQHTTLCAIFFILVSLFFSIICILVVTGRQKSTFFEIFSSLRWLLRHCAMRIDPIAPQITTRMLYITRSAFLSSFRICDWFYYFRQAIT